jgi:OmcA/MtrC family decaheme c-type cytochrome
LKSCSWIELNGKQALYVSFIGIIIATIALGMAYYKTPGPEGPQGLQGEQGSQGIQGPQGSKGDPGTPGADGMVDYDLILPDKGLVVSLNKVEIGSDLKTVVTLEITDPNGLPIHPDDLIGIRFMLTSINVDEVTGQTSYNNYFTRVRTGASYTFKGETVEPAMESWENPDRDSDGSWVEVATGVYEYTFGKVLPADYDTSATHLLALYAERDPVGDGRHGESISNIVYSFVPDGSAMETTRLISDTETCNRCHDPLEAHGGVRQEYVLCLMCHNPDAGDPETGNTVNMGPMIHKIHKGADLNEVQEGGSYYIVGHSQSIHDYSDVHFPTDVRNCDMCHTGPDGDNYKTQPSRVACGSCHDEVNFETGEGHGPGLPLSDDETCSNCHSSTIGSEFDISIPGAHTISTSSSLLKGVNFEILSIKNTAPGENPVVTYTITENDGDPINLGDMDRVRFVVAGPTTDFAGYWREDGGLDSIDNGDGTYSYTLENPIPLNATGSYGIGIEGRTVVDLDDEHVEVRDTAYNDILYFAVTDSKAVPRRAIVSQENCDSCHLELSIHGDNRKNIEYCAFCHIPSETDEEVRPEEEMPPVTIDLKNMIHAIHLGEEQDEPLIIYGHRGSIHNFSEVRYPGDLRNCAACHIDDSYTLPLADGVLPTVVTQEDEIVSTTPPVTSVCTSCHDSEAVAAHAELQTTEAGVESCAICHDEGKESDIATVHSGIHYSNNTLINEP